MRKSPSFYFWKFDPSTEEAYALYMCGKDIRNLRLTLFCGILASICFIAVDFFRETDFTAVVSLRGVIVPVSIYLIWITYRYPFTPKQVQWFIQGVLYTNLLLAMALGMAGHMPFFYLTNTVSLLLYMSMSISGVRYRYGLFFNVITLVCFLAFGTRTNESFNKTQIPNVVLNFFLSSIAGAFIERSKRENFMQYAHLHQQKSDLNELDQQKNKIISILSHDISSPLISLSSLVELYRKQHISQEEFNTFLPEVSSRLEKANFLVHNLVRWSKSQIDGFTVDLKPLNLNALITENINLFEAQAREKGIVLAVSASRQYEVAGDREMVNLIIRNILSNAIKFSEPGETIHLRVTVDKHRVSLCISNKGKPISPEVIGKLFTYQIKPQVGSLRERGAGLGLAIAQHFANLNGGCIVYHAAPDNPAVSIFCIELKEA